MSVQQRGENSVNGLFGPDDDFEPELEYLDWDDRNAIYGDTTEEWITADSDDFVSLEEKR